MENLTIKERVEEALNQIRPYLQGDGGDIVLVGITPDRVVQLRLTGACAHCFVSSITLKTVVEPAILRAVPHIREVELVR